MCRILQSSGTGVGPPVARFVSFVNMSRVDMPCVLLVVRFSTSSIMPTRTDKIVYFIQNTGAFCSSLLQGNWLFATQNLRNFNIAIINKDRGFKYWHLKTVMLPFCVEFFFLAFLSHIREHDLFPENTDVPPSQAKVLTEDVPPSGSHSCVWPHSWAPRRIPIL